MTKPVPSTSRKSPAGSGVRSLILALTVTSTLALWAVFSKVERDQASAAEPLPISTDAAAEVVTEEVVIDLPPIPTLIPTSNAQTAAAQSGIVPTLPGLLPTPNLPQFVPPVKITSREPGARSDRPSRPDRGSGGGGGGGGGSTRPSR